MLYIYIYAYVVLHLYIYTCTIICLKNFSCCFLMIFNNVRPVFALKYLLVNQLANPRNL